MSTQLVSLIRLLANSYPSYRPNPDTLSLYASKLKDYPIMDVQDACDKIIETNKFFPSLAELIQLTQSMAYFRDVRHPELRRPRKVSAPDPFRAFDDVSIQLMKARRYKSADDFTEEDIDYLYSEAGIARESVTITSEQLTKICQVIGITGETA